MTGRIDVNNERYVSGTFVPVRQKVYGEVKYSCTYSSPQTEVTCQLYIREKSPRYPLDRNWVGFKAGLEAAGNGKISCLYWELNPDSWVV
jgi:hypothetical protein